MNITILMKFAISIFLPFLIGGIIIGGTFGVIGYYTSMWLNMFENQAQYEMVFWLFLGMGGVAGAVGAIQSLIGFLKKPPENM